MHTFHDSKITFRKLFDFGWSGLNTFEIITISPNSNISGTEWEGKFLMNEILFLQSFATL